MPSEIVTQALERLKRDQSHWSDIYQAARDDLNFLSDDPYAQWDKEDYENRRMTRRPALTIDQLSQFIHQVANDIRMNTPTINVIPSTGGDVKTADAYKGIIRNIEYQSSADDAYDTAALNAVRCGIGFIRVDHDYYDDNSFDQVLKVCRVVNPLACWIDAESIEINGCDAKHGTILDKMLVADFKKKYPDKNPVSFENEKSNIEAKDDDYIYIAEHFVIDEQEKTIAVDEMGNITEAVKGVFYAKTRTVKQRKVMRYKLSGEDVLEETTFPGIYIPLIPVYGEEVWIENKRNVFSLIRKSKQAQQMYNYWKSLETELLMKAPQAPVMAAVGQVEDFKDDWTDPSKAAVLRYKQTDAAGNPAPAPQRLEPPTIPTGIVNASRMTVDDIKATMGIYNASLGMRSNEQSGKAINARKVEGDIATYHFGDNLTKSIAQVGRVLVFAIPEIYDTARIVRIIGKEEKSEEIGVNGAIVEDQDETIDLTKGRYDVKVITGAPFTTQRQEAAQFFTDIVTRQPDLMTIMGDLLFENMDFTGAHAMAERMKKVIDPKFLSEEERAEMQQEQAQPDPEKMQMMAFIEESKKAIADLEAQLKDKQDEMMLKAQSTASDNEIEKAKLEMQLLELRIEEQKAATEMQLKEQEIQLKARELSLKELQLQADVALKAGAQELALTQDADPYGGLPAA